MKIEKIEVDGKILIESLNVTMKSTGFVVISFGSETKIKIIFLNDDTVNDGKRYIKKEVDDDSNIMIVSCFNFKTQNPSSEGIFSNYDVLFENGGVDYYFNFLTSKLSEDARLLTVNFYKDK